MTDIQLFNAPTGDHIRVLMVEGEPWFVARDLCDALGIGQTARAVEGLDPDEVSTTHVTDALGRRQVTYVVNEPGLYALTLRSRKPDARHFRRWITHDVLPALRRTGTYSLTDPRQHGYDLPTSFAEALRQLASTVEERDTAHAELATAAPKADAWDTLASADGDYAVADAAKLLSRDPAISVGRDRLFALLRDCGWAYRQRVDGRHRAYQDAVETGRLTELPASHYHPRTGQLVLDPPQLRVTVKGLHQLHRYLGGTMPLALDHQEPVGQLALDQADVGTAKGW